MSALTSIVIAAVGCLIAWIQYSSWIKKEIELNTWNLLDLLHHRENQIDRLSVPRIMRDAENTSFSDLDVPDKACLARTSGMFVLAGILAEKNRIDLSILLPIFSFSIQDNYRHLRKYREWRETLDGYPKSKAFDYFEELAEKARVFAETGTIKQCNRTSWKWFFPFPKA